MADRRGEGVGSVLLEGVEGNSGDGLESKDTGPIGDPFVAVEKRARRGRT